MARSSNGIVRIVIYLHLISINMSVCIYLHGMDRILPELTIILDWNIPEQFLIGSMCRDGKAYNYTNKYSQN